MEQENKFKTSASLLDYVKKYLWVGIAAGVIMSGEVIMDLWQPSVMSRIVDEGVLGTGNGGVGNLQIIMKLGLLMVGMTLFGALCGSLNNVFAHIFAQNIGNDIRKDCFKNIMKFSFPQVDRFGTGSLVTRVTNDITQVQNYVSSFIRGMVRMVIFMVGSIYCMFRINTHFGITVLCASPVIVLFLAFCLSRVNPMFYRLQNCLDGMNDMLQEDISGIRIIKACVHETYEKIRFGKSNDELVKNQLAVLYIFSFMRPASNIVMYVIMAVILMMARTEILNGLATPGTIIASITYITQLLNGILMLIMIFQNISRGQVSWKRLQEILECEPELKDGADRFGESAAAGAAGKNMENKSAESEQAPAVRENPVTGKKGLSVEFRNASFSYPDNEKKVLDHINLKIAPGETFAIMGATGCGKSTLVNLIPRFYDVTEGEILVDGKNVKSYVQTSLRNQVSIALQKSELFSDTIRNNIFWGAGNDVDTAEIPEEEVRNAARIAQAEEFILNQPDGYDTMIAERGMSLSGGQKQRISIARAVLKQAGILIFDDATSALDLKTEANLYEALKRERPECTKIIVAQRVASVRRADRIAVLENGKMLACDTHERLIEICPVYRDIVISQLGEEGLSNG